jgi:hypothetical protein
MEQILDILYTIPDPWIVLPACVVVFVIPGIIGDFCFKSVSRTVVVYAWTFAGTVIATLITCLVIHLFISPFIEGETERLMVISLTIGVPCGWALGLIVPVASYMLTDRRARKKANAA